MQPAALGPSGAQRQFYHQPDSENQQYGHADSHDNEVGGLAMLEIPFPIASALYAEKGSQYAKDYIQRSRGFLRFLRRFWGIVRRSHRVWRRFERFRVDCLGDFSGQTGGLRCRGTLLRYIKSSIGRSATMSAKLPLLSMTAPDDVIAWWRTQTIRRDSFLNHVASVARRLPTARFIFNLCEDRYLFLVAFAAVGANGQTNLLPSSRAELHLQRLAKIYADNASITDKEIASWLERAGEETPVVAAVPEWEPDRLVAIAFTSGSTGEAKPNPKTWGELVSGARQAQQRFGFDRTMTIVATVPPQHMYGLETSIMTPLYSGARIHASRPFFPEDVRAALAAVPAPCVLVTTPVHLQACARAGLHWPQPAFLISATAPLALELAAQIETLFNAPVLEIYGCTEAGSIASRRTVAGNRWRLYDGFQLRDGALSGAHLPAPAPLNDLVEVYSETEFKLLGRREDVINIAGKRTSLGFLNHQLNDIDGVAEGVFLMPDAINGAVERLMAVVVAPDLTERQLLAALSQRLDAVFLPRPLLKVDALPRNETGKATREALLALVARLRP